MLIVIGVKTAEDWLLSRAGFSRTRFAGVDSNADDHDEYGDGQADRDGDTDRNTGYWFHSELC